MYKERVRKRDINPFAIKKGFYITEMNMGYLPGDGYELISTSEIAGPFKTLDRAREIFKKLYVKTNGEIIGILTSVVQSIDHMVIQLHGTDLRREYDIRSNHNKFR